MDNKVDTFHDILSVSRGDVQVVHRQVVPQVPSRVKARSLKTTQLGIVSLPMRYLICLVDVCCVVDPIRNVGVLPKTGHMKCEIGNERKYLKIGLVQFNSHQIQSNCDAKHSF